MRCPVLGAAADRLSGLGDSKLGGKSPGRHCHSTSTLPLTAIDCHHSLGIYAPMLLPLLSFSAKMTVPPLARRRARRRPWESPGRGRGRARSHRRVALPFTHFVPDSRAYSVPLFLKRQCDRTLGRGRARARWREGKLSLAGRALGLHLAARSEAAGARRAEAVVQGAQARQGSA